MNHCTNIPAPWWGKHVSMATLPRKTEVLPLDVVVEHVKQLEERIEAAEKRASERDVSEANLGRHFDMAIQQRDQADREIVVLKAEIERLKGLLRNSGRNRERDALEIEQLKAELAKAMGQRKILNEGDSQ